MYWNLVLVFLLAVWTAANDPHEKEEKKWAKAFMDCCNETPYNITLLMEKLEKKEKFCTPEEEPKNWATCMFQKIGAMDSEKKYIKTFFSERCKTDADKEKMVKCNNRLDTEDVTPDTTACFIMDCMNELDVQSIYDDEHIE